MNIKGKMREKSGITLITLAVTIIILLILAGITIATITSDNGIIKNANDAKEQTEIAEEKEILDRATIQAMGNNKRGNLVQDELQEQLDKITDSGKTEVSDNGEEFEVVFVESNRYYTVDKDGNIVEEGKIVIDKSPGDITKDENGNTLKGDESEPYEIWCIEDLVKFSKMVNEENQNFLNKYVVLKTNLNFDSNFSYMNTDTTEFDVYLGGNGSVPLKEQLSDNGNGFTPIGKAVSSYIHFSGNFEGQNHVIKNIYINKNSYAGLFGAIHDGAKICNLTVEGNIIVGNGPGAGGIVSWAGNSIIENCSSIVNISGKAFGVGGIIGICQYGDVKIKNCANIGNINNLNSIGTGGIVGVIQKDFNVNIVNTYNDGIINGNRSVGGFIGVTGGKVCIYNCYQLKQVTGNGEGTGGIIGRTYSDEIILRNIYSIGSVNSNNQKGGIIGMIEDSSKIKSNYVYYKRENELTGIYNQEDRNFNIFGYTDKDWDSNLIIENLNSGIELQESSIDKSDWKKWKLGENGYPIFE